MAALAMDYNDAPLIVVQPTQQVAQAPVPSPESELGNFPDWAVTKAGENSAGNENPVPNAPTNPENAPQAPNAQNPSNAAAPTAPASPASPTDKLWPIDTIPIFMKSCMGFHIELAAPCKCVITNLMVEMPHDEFLRLSADGSIEKDQRLTNIRYRCLGTPEKQE